MGLGPGEPIGDLLGLLGVDFQAVRTPSYRVHLPDRQLDIVPDVDGVREGCRRGSSPAERLEARAAAVLAIAGGRRARPSCERRHGPAAARSGRLATLVHDLRILGLRAACWPASTSAVDRAATCSACSGWSATCAFRSLIAMLLQDTAQAGPETVPFANAAACLQAYRLGMSRPRGGMRALVEGIGRRSPHSGATSGPRRWSIGSSPDRRGPANHGGRVSRS